MRINKKNLIVAEFKTLLKPFSIGFMIYSLAIGILSTVFSFSGIKSITSSNEELNNFIGTVFRTLLIFNLFMGVFMASFERVSPDKSKLAFHLYEKQFVTKVKWAVSLTSYTIRSLLGAVVLMIILTGFYSGSVKPNLAIDYGKIIEMFFIALVPCLAVQSFLYIGANYVQSLTTDQGLARLFLFLFSIVVVGPILGISYAITASVSVRNFFFNTAWVEIVFRVVPPLNLLSPLLSDDSYWAFSFVFWAELIILSKSFVWRVYSIGQKRFYTSIES